MKEVTEDQVCQAVRAFIAAGKGGADMMGAIRRAVEEAYAAAPAAPVAAPAPSELDLTKLRQYLERTSEENGYGFARPSNPHDFFPDHESCSPDEIAAHKAACEAYDKGEYTPERGSEWVGNMHILRAPWGIGAYVFRDPEAVTLIAQIDAISPPDPYAGIAADFASPAMLTTQEPPCANT